MSVDGRKDAAAAAAAASACDDCALNTGQQLVRRGEATGAAERVVALAGNPNVGKSTVFNALTGLRQHTGNWPGKTVARAEGAFAFGGAEYRIVDLPGTYSLLSTSVDEDVARDFILFGRPDVTVIVADATRLERNLNLVLQVLDITDRAVVCVNLVDEATRHGITVDARALSRELGVPVVLASARRNAGIPELLARLHEVATGAYVCRPRRARRESDEAARAIDTITRELERGVPGLANARWVAIRLLEGDQQIADALRTGRLHAHGTASEDDPATGGRRPAAPGATPDDPVEGIIARADALRWETGEEFHDAVIEALYADAARIADACVAREGTRTPFAFDRALDRVLTSRTLGFPLMLAMLALVFWLTIEGSNVPSSLLASLLVDTMHPWLRGLGLDIGLPAWLNGFLFDGVYLATAWVVSVMLPPMAIFFPLFTLLEDFGYLPRVAFNLDALFQRVGAHGKQALTMSMGWGCNAAGVVATRIIDSPRERLIAILTNNFSLCNGRWPTQILVATIFIGAAAPPAIAGIVSAGAVVSVALLGVFFVFVTSWSLSRTVLRGEASSFSLELPPYRPPRLLQTLYTSLIDRTLIVLWRAVVFAAPAGAVIWLSANVTIGGTSIAEHVIHATDPFALFLGLNGVILLAYIIAIPANEIVIPTVLMLTTLVLGAGGAGTGTMFELDSLTDTAALLQAGGWTTLTGVNLMLFSLLHNPCSTTIYTIYKETRSLKWTLVASVMPVVMGILVCLVVAQVWRMLA